MQRRVKLLIVLLCAVAGQAFGWSNHTVVSYRALEKMPEVASAAPVSVEPLEAFLKAEEKAIEVLLANQESWARANIDMYPARPEPLVFRADPTRADAARRLAFLVRGTTPRCGCSSRKPALRRHTAA